MTRSGSTWQFNVLRLLMGNLTNVVSGWILDVQNPTEHKYAIIKAHAYVPLANDAAWTKVLTFTSHRDIRDVRASQYRAFNEYFYEIEDSYIKSHEKLSRISVYDMAYEKFLQNPEDAVISMAEALQNHLPGYQWSGDLYTVNHIVDTVNAQAKAMSAGEGLNTTHCPRENSHCMYDKTTIWRKGHITDGRWGSFKETFIKFPNGAKMCQEVTHRREGWLRKHGYPLTEAC
eukprot:g6427.t1